GHERIGAEMLAREKHAARQPERRIELALERSLETPDIDAELFQKAACGVAEQALRRLQGFAAAIAPAQPAADGEFVALGVTAEIVVIIEDQDAGIRLLHSVEIGRRKPADAGADHDEVILLLEGKRREGRGVAVAQGMRGLVGAVMLTAHP